MEAKSEFRRMLGWAEFLYLLYFLYLIYLLSKKKPAEKPPLPAKKLAHYTKLSGFLYIGRLRTLRSLHNFKFDLFSFLQSAVPVPDDCRVMNENIRAVLSADESVAFHVIEPLDRSLHLDCPPCAEIPIAHNGAPAHPKQIVAESSRTERRVKRNRTPAICLFS